MKKILLSVISIILFMSMFNIKEGRTENIMVDNLQISVNNDKINETALITEGNYVLVPLRAVLEGIGADVRWEQTTGDVYFDYLNKNYVCQLEEQNQSIYNSKVAKICEVEKKGSNLYSDYIPLNDMGISCAYRNINGRIYLFGYGVENLMKYFDYSMETDLENSKISITSNSSDTTTDYADGNQKTKTDNTGLITTYTYDAYNRLTKEAGNDLYSKSVS